MDSGDLHQFREEKAIELAEMHARHGAESSGLFESYKDVLRARFALDEDEVRRELVQIIRASTPYVREFD